VSFLIENSDIVVVLLAAEQTYWCSAWCWHRLMLTLTLSGNWILLDHVRVHNLKHTVVAASLFCTSFSALLFPAILSTVHNIHRVPKKNQAPWCLIITLANIDRFSKFFTKWFVRKFSMYASQKFPPHLQYVATLPCESRKFKNVTHFDSTQQSIDMFLRTLWGLDLTFNSQHQGAWFFWNTV